LTRQIPQTFAYGDFSGDLIDIGGVDITITSAPGAIIDGNGQAWWDGQGSNGGITKYANLLGLVNSRLLTESCRPDHFIVLKTTGTSLVENLHIQNWPVHCWEVTSASGTTITGLTMDNSAGNAPNAKSSGLPAAHNSDGFDVSGSTDIIIENTTVINQDDCVAVTSGTGITIQNMVCDGGHGLSIGSIGGKSKNDVANVLFTNSVVKNSQNGARIKTNSGTTGTVTNVTWSNIQVENISIYGIDIQQDYLNGGPTGTYVFSSVILLFGLTLGIVGTPTNGVTITGITMSNITGTTQSSAQNYYILCGSGSCTNFDFENVSITGGTDDSCNYTPTEGNFVCN
jgi:polygalacturonase